jgi:hypothetical protein
MCLSNWQCGLHRYEPVSEIIGIRCRESSDTGRFIERIRMEYPKSENEDIEIRSGGSFLESRRSVFGFLNLEFGCCG